MENVQNMEISRLLRDRSAYRASEMEGWSCPLVVWPIIWPIDRGDVFVFGSVVGNGGGLSSCCRRFVSLALASSLSNLHHRQVGPDRGSRD